MPLFQSKTNCEAIDIEMIFILEQKINSFSQERFWNYPRFESEKFWNSDMAPRPLLRTPKTLHVHRTAWFISMRSIA